MSDEQLSVTMRDYLVNIYRLSEDVLNEAYVSTSRLADELQVSAPAVNRMVTKLRELGLLYHERYQGISLTETGKLEALKQLRRQRITEVFLYKIMGFGWHEVGLEAAEMSTTLGEKILERMLEMAGNPECCPHGSPIPEPDGTFTQIDDQLLTQVEPENDYIITRVITREPDRLEYLEALGLVPENTFTLLHAAPFNGPMQLQLGREYRIIGHNLAEMIRVKPSV